MKKYQTAFGQALRQARLEHGMSLQDVQDVTGVHRQQIHAYEMHRSEPSLGVALHLAHRLDFSLDLLAGDLSCMTL